MLKMDEYYQVLHFLKDSTLDRLYPCEKYFYDSEGESIAYEGDSFIFETNHQTFIGTDYIEILLESSEPIQTSDLTFNLSEYLNCYAPEISLKPSDNTTIEANTPTKVIFPLDKSNTMSKKSRDLTGVRSVELITPNNENHKIYEITFRSYSPKFTLEEIDAFVENGKYYITSRLHMTDVPDELKDHIYTATAGYAWMSVWEFEARVMNDEQKNAKSYGKWLFSVVDDAIDAYKVANGISDDDELFVLDELVTSRPLRW